MNTLEEKALDVEATEERINLCHEMFYQYGDNFLATELVQLARHYQDLTGSPYHKVFDYGQVLGR